MIVSWFLSIPSHTGVPIAKGLKKADHFLAPLEALVQSYVAVLPFTVGEIVSSAEVGSKCCVVVSQKQ